MHAVCSVRHDAGRLSKNEATHKAELIMLFKVLAIFAAVASGFEMPALSRRDFARAVAAAPLAVATQAAFADANNVMYGVGKAGLGAGDVDKYGAPTKAVGSPPSVDASGAKVPAAALRTASEYATKPTRPGEAEKNAAQKAAYARLMAK